MTKDVLDGVVAFPAEFAGRYRQLGYWEDRLLGEVFAECFQRFGSRPAVIASEQSYSFRDIEGYVTRLSGHLLALGLRTRDRIVIQLPNTIELICVYLAAVRIGVIPVMALPAHRHREISHYVAVTDAVGYVISGRDDKFDFQSLAEQLMAEQASLRYVLVAGLSRPSMGFYDLNELLVTEPAELLTSEPVGPEDPALFQLSGGTTGVPKLIPRSHNDYLYNTKLAVSISGVRPTDALLVILPLAHNFPLACPGLQGFLLSGARTVLANVTAPREVFGLVERHGITHLEIVPALLIRMVRDESLSDYDLSSLRVITSGGQRLQPEIKREVEKLIPSATVQEVFGMAEGLLMYTRLDDPDEVRYLTAGRPVCPDDEVVLIDDNGEVVADGEVGELACRGPYTLRGYYKADEHNARSFTADGFYLSGDLMRLHPSGNYIVEGRKKDLINRGGEKISAEEIENLLLGHPDVHNVACVPIPDPVLGERTCACVIPMEGARPTLAELTEYLSNQGIARFKMPERLLVVDTFPLSPFGKVSKNTLAARAAAEASDG
jgi:2,3-dihydroxybenzoate-AMP ligase